MTSQRKPRRGPKTADELMAELEADPAYLHRIAERDDAHQARVAQNADEFALVRRALDDAGLPSEDFGRFTSGRHPDVIRPSVFDYHAAVPVLLDVLPRLTRPVVKEAVVRSLTTSKARPAAATAMFEEFRRTPEASQPALKWAIGNALSTVTTIEHTDAILDLALDASHGAGRQMIVERLARIFEGRSDRAGAQVAPQRRRRRASGNGRPASKARPRGGLGVHPAARQPLLGSDSSGGHAADPPGPTGDGCPFWSSATSVVEHGAVESVQYQETAPPSAPTAERTAVPVSEGGLQPLTHANGADGFHWRQRRDRVGVLRGTDATTRGDEVTRAATPW